MTLKLSSPVSWDMQYEEELKYFSQKLVFDIKHMNRNGLPIIGTPTEYSRYTELGTSHPQLTAKT